MGLQKYRADKVGERDANGAIPWYALWMGGPTLSKIENCPIQGSNLRRMVYITGEPLTWYSLPAACKVKGATVRGFVTGGEDGRYFVPMTREIKGILK